MDLAVASSIAPLVSSAARALMSSSMDPNELDVSKAKACGGALFVVLLLSFPPLPNPNLEVRGVDDGAAAGAGVATGDPRPRRSSVATATGVCAACVINEPELRASSSASGGIFVDI